MAFTPNATVLIVLLEGIPSILLAVAVWFLLTDRPAKAAWIGLINSLGNISGFVAPYVTGALSDATGGNRFALWVVGVCMVSSEVVTWALRRIRS